ncbi:MAG: DNA repair protein RecN [Cyclobacteriaceae bacterium]|nr:DNA repair protein RecN [Cyclobacteriaceae bacterium]
MLINLSIKNYVLIESLQMSLSGQLNTITGETGAGKSIMLGAVGLLLGNRADTKTLLSIDQKCVIEGLFDISDYSLKSKFEELDLDYAAQTIIRREIAPSGKSRAFINDTPVLLDTLKDLGNYLLDIHSQHDTLLLAESHFQMDIIDSFAGNSSEKSTYHNSYQKYLSIEKRYRKLKNSAADLKKEYDYNKFLLDELAAAALQNLDLNELEEEQNLLDNAEEIKLSLNQAIELLDGNEFSSLPALGQTQQLVNKLSGFSEKYKNLADRLQSTYIELSDVKREIENEESLTEHDPERASQLSEILGNLYRLFKKHNTNSLVELRTIEESLAEKVSSVENFDLELEKLKLERDYAFNEVLEHGTKLTESRIQISEMLCTEAKKVLHQLSIPEAELRVQLTPVEPGPTGCDDIRLLFSANQGIPPQELKKVASGGEFSRLMFTFKYMMAGKQALPTLIFDEIDTGVSGEVARQLGIMMKKMGKNHQVITITHLPQIAAMGEKHFFVYKKPGLNSTVSQIRELISEERITEIAKMISGDNPSLSAVESARELIG